MAMQNQGRQINCGQVFVLVCVELICSTVRTSIGSLNGAVALTIGDRHSCETNDQQFIARIHR